MATPTIVQTSSSFFGKIAPPVKNNPYFTTTKGEGLFLFLSNILKFAGVVGGIFMIIQFITAGFAYLNASGDPKKIEAAWAKIWQSMLGLAIIASAFVLASVVERLTGIKILNPEIPTP